MLIDRLAKLIETTALRQQIRITPNSVHQLISRFALATGSLEMVEASRAGDAN